MLDLSQVLKNGAQPQSGEEALLHTLGKGAQCGSVSRLDVGDAGERS